MGDSDDDSRPSVQSHSGPHYSSSSNSLHKTISAKKARKRKRQEKLLGQLERKSVRKEQEKEQKDNVFQAQQKRGDRNQGRDYTVSLALPGSILDNAQSAELRTYLAGQIARALAVFAVDEVVVYEDESKTRGVGEDQGRNKNNSTEGDYKGVGVAKHGQGVLQLARILQYLECPQYLRKHFFPIHADLKYAGVLNPTDMPHHLRATEKSSFREGVVLDRPPTKRGSLVNAGLGRTTIIDRTLTPGLRVTLRLDPNAATDENPSVKVYGQVVSPNIPRTEAGIFWGYQVRLANNLSSVFAECPHKGGYDHTIGTSERGGPVDECTLKPGFKHLLVVFGGVKGLEAALDADDDLEGEDPEPLFDTYLNTCPIQGSRTIRTEEAVLISMAALRPKIAAAAVAVVPEAAEEASE